MLKRKLYLQIYGTIIASLLAVVIISGIVFSMFGRDRLDQHLYEIAGKMAWLTLPAATASQGDQQKAVERLGRELEISVSLFDSNRQLLGTFGGPRRIPKRILEDLEDDRADGKSRRFKHWHRMKRGRSWILVLPDSRLLAIDLGKRRPRHPILMLLAYLVLISAVVLLVAYPFVRKLTSRLERLQSGVEKIGSGDLSARVDVKGSDEVAHLATSFNDAAGRIERLLNSNKLLLANASHELRTPLSRIRLGVEMLKKDGDSKRHTALQNDISELDGLIDEILLMSRLDANSKLEIKEEIDLLALAAEECAHYSHCTLSGDNATVVGDSRLLRRLLRNLLDNAAKHGKPPVKIKLESKSDQIHLQVFDSGGGIHEQNRQHVFEPFYRSPGKQNVEGFGLGLSLVKQIAETHGGSVRILDGPNSIVEVILPCVTGRSVDA